MWPVGQWEASKKIAWEGDIPIQPYTHIATTRPNRPRGPIRWKTMSGNVSAVLAWNTSEGLYLRRCDVSHDCSNLMCYPFSFSSLIILSGKSDTACISLKHKLNLQLHAIFRMQKFHYMYILTHPYNLTFVASAVIHNQLVAFCREVSKLSHVGRIDDTSIFAEPGNWQ